MLVWLITFNLQSLCIVAISLAHSWSLYVSNISLQQTFWHDIEGLPHCISYTSIGNRSHAHFSMHDQLHLQSLRAGRILINPPTFLLLNVAIIFVLCIACPKALSFYPKKVTYSVGTQSSTWPFEHFDSQQTIRLLSVMLTIQVY